MAATKGLTQPRLSDLRARLIQGLKDQGITAKVELEPSGLTGRYRLYVISRDFEKLYDAERQAILWRVLKDHWKREDQLRITLSLTLTEKEAGVK